MSSSSSPRLKKHFGQHHLVDAAPLRAALDELQPNDRDVLEIGPGGGVMTRELLALGARRVLALELDPEWAFHLLCERLGPRLQVVVGDALDLPWERLPTDLRITGNLPYNVATPLIVGFLCGGRAGQRAVFMVQREVGERLVASPGESAYGSLSVLGRSRATLRLLGRLRPGHFRPPPAVHSALVGIELGELPVEPSRWPAFRDLIRQAFASRRKTLLNSLSSVHPRNQVRQALTRLGWPSSCRAERLDVADFVDLLLALDTA